MENVKHALKHIYWIGHSPCAGKSKVARILTEDYGFHYYKSDDAYDDHMERSTGTRSDRFLS